MGGDAFALVYRARDGSFTAINGSGAAPRAAEALFETGIPQRGPRATTVPGAVAAWADLLERFGTRSLGDVLRPAIQYAREGFPVGDRLARSIASTQGVLASFYTSAAVFLRDGRPPQPGDVLVQADLAESLSMVAERGKEAFYQGELAEALVACSRAQGGLLALEDFAAHRSVWADPVSTFYRDYQVLAQPPVSQAHILLEELNIVEGDDLVALGHNSAPLIHLMVEAKKLAFADRYRYTGDPDFVRVPMEAMLSKAHARRQRARIDPDRAARDPEALPVPDTHTTYLAVVDPEGNAISYIQSIFSPFGCGMVAGDTGIVLNNRATGFSLDPASPNVLQPGKRPVHTLGAYMVARSGLPVLVLGTPGASAQVQTVFQLIVDLLDFRMDVQEAIEAPRWRSEGDDLLLEGRVPTEVRDRLAAMGHRVQPAPDFDPQTGGAQVIKLDHAHGVLHGGADPRREGYALGW